MGSITKMLLHTHIFNIRQMRHLACSYSLRAAIAIETHGWSGGGVCEIQTKPQNHKGWVMYFFTTLLPLPPFQHFKRFQHAKKKKKKKSYYFFKLSGCFPTDVISALQTIQLAALIAFFLLRSSKWFPSLSLEQQTNRKSLGKESIRRQYLQK